MTDKPRPRPWVEGAAGMGDDRPVESMFPAARSFLADYDLTLNQAVEVELLVAQQHGMSSTVAVNPRVVEGTITGATVAVLILKADHSHRVTRIPWAAIATITNRVTHPANQ